MYRQMPQGLLRQPYVSKQIVHHIPYTIIGKDFVPEGVYLGHDKTPGIKNGLKINDDTVVIRLVPR